MPLSIGLDLGTTSISVAAIDQTGRVVACRGQTHKADLPHQPPSHAEQSPDLLWQRACALLGDLVQELPEQPVSLGVTGQMHGLLLVDESLNPLGPLITWRDRRALDTLPTGDSPLDQFRSRCDPHDIQRTGCNPSPGYLAVTLFTLIERGELPASARWALLLADWFTARLTNISPRIDRTQAASTGVFDLEHDRWSPMIQQTGLPPNLFPPVVETGTLLGNLTPAAAQETGLPVGLPVTTAIGDHQAALLGSLPWGESAIQINIGTGGQISLPTDQFFRTNTSDTRYLAPGRYLLVGAGMVGGDAYAWLCDTVAQWLSAFGVERSDSEIYQTFNELVSASPPGASGVTLDPRFRGTRRDPNIRAAISGLDHGNFTPGNLGRALWEGVAQHLYQFWQEHQQHLPTPTRLIATGNAVRENPPLAESLTRVFNLPLWTPDHREEAAFGAALLAGVGSGLWPNWQLANQAIRLSQHTTMG